MADAFDEEDYFEGGFADETGDDYALGGGRRRRGAEGPTDVTFSVCLEQPPKDGEVVVITGSAQELAAGVVMHPCRSCRAGQARLWTATVVMDVKNLGGAGPAAAMAAGPGGGMFGAFGGMLGGMGGFGGAAGALGSGGPPLFNCVYTVVHEASGREVLKEDKQHDEHGSLRKHYYHRMSSKATKDEEDEDAFPLFIHDEIMLLQTSETTDKEFMARFLQLANAPFAKKRSLLDKALEQLIEIWGDRERPPTNLVLAIAATLGYFRKQVYNAEWGHYHNPDLLGAFGGGAASEKEKEKEPPPSLIVCRWIVQHCPTKAEQEEEERARAAAPGPAGAAGAAGAAEDRRGRGNMDFGGHQLQRNTQLGVLQAAETLYLGERSFEWLKLITFLQDHQLPNAVSSSMIQEAADQKKLEKSFLSTMALVFDSITEKFEEVRVHPWGDSDAEKKEKEKKESDLRQYQELYLSGLCKFSPSVECLCELLRRVVKAPYGNEIIQSVCNFLLNRLRSLNFGQKDKDVLKAMIREFKFLATSDELAQALLTNSHHPSDTFRAEEIVEFVKLVTQTSEGTRPASHQLQQAVKRWLNRNFARTVERQERKQEDAKDGARDAFGSRDPSVRVKSAEYQAQKDEIREQIRVAIRGWHMVLQVPCFKMEEECLRLIVFELTQANFFKDPDHYLVLDSMLELEDEIKRTSSVRHLEDELQRVMVRLTRDCYEEEEGFPSNDSKLLQLLFLKPSEKRFYVLEALMNMRQATAAIRAILQNEPIWSRLLSPAWLNSPALANMGAHGLRQTQQEGLRTLSDSANKLESSMICLHDMHVILEYRPIYESLVRSQDSVNKKSLGAIEGCKEVIQKFDIELTQLKTYLKYFCQVGLVEAGRLESLVGDINGRYQNIALKEASQLFVGLSVRDHLSWLYSLRASDVFSNIWKQACGVDERPVDDRTRQAQLLSQDDVVGRVIPIARGIWEQLSKSIEQGTAILEDIRWCVDMTWTKVRFELQLLEETAPKAAPWADRAMQQTQAMRLAAKLKVWAPSMLHLKEVLKDLFPGGGADECANEFEDVNKTHANMWNMQLSKTIDLVQPFKASINTLSEDMQDYVILLAKHDAALLYVLEQKELDEFNRLIALVRPNTDDSVVLGALASLQSTRTFLSETLYSKPPYSGLRSFLQQMATLQVDAHVTDALGSVQVNFDPLTQLLITNARSPGIQAYHDLITLGDKGSFTVKCTTKSEELITCSVPTNTYSYEFLSELRRQLLMTDVPTEGMPYSHEELERRMNDMVEKLVLMERFSTCSMDLFRLGHFAYYDGLVVLEVKPDEDVEKVRANVLQAEAKLNDWTVAVDAARQEHYFLNYYTVRELCYVISNIVGAKSSSASWNNIWPLLRCAGPTMDQDNLKRMITENSLTEKCGVGVGTEVERLNALGQLLGQCFKSLPPVHRKLEGIEASREQGDLLITGMKGSEQGIPVFVCTADDPAKVTELILSIYTRRERVPEAEELLLCSGNTTMEEIEILLYRFFKARKHNREDRLYCLGNVHLLPYVVQCGTVEALRRHEETVGYEAASALVFVSGMQNQMLTNALNRRHIAVGPLPRNSLHQAVKKIGEEYHGRQMQAVASKMNGMGKTHHILRQMYQLQEDPAVGRGSNIRHHIEIRETTDIADLVQALLLDPTDTRVATAIHVDLAHILPMYVDTLLFEVLVVGMLRDPHNCSVYHRRPQDFFFIEIPNTPEEKVAMQLSFCLLLPRVYLQMTQDRMEPDMPALEWENGSHKVVFKKNENLALVGKTLEAMKKEAFNPKSKEFHVQWRANTVPEIPLERTYELLDDVCCGPTSPPSFLVFMNFVKFMGELIRMAEGWNMMNLQLLQNFDPGLKHFKHCFFRLLIETSRDFALRQVPKMAVESSPLAPTPTARLVRQNSTNTRGSPGLDGRPGTGRPGLHRTMSRTVSQNATTNAETETGGVGRVEISSYARRFDQMPSWESMIHPIASFKKNESGVIIGCNIMSLSKDFLSTFIDRNLQNSLNLNDLKLEKDWAKVTHQEAVQLVHQVEGGELLKKKDHLQGPKEYVVTVDNLLKLMSIQQRLRFDLPVILMGETGCGKTALVKFLASTLDFKLFTLDIHGGITDQQIIDFMDMAIGRATDARGALVFFDEINAANCMAIFKSIIIDRVYCNKIVPTNVRIISCCNPYRIRKDKQDEDMALTFVHKQEGSAASGITDPMKRLVYRVHPLPESLIDVVSDFGALSEKSEELYIGSMLKKELPRFGAEDENSDSTEYDSFMGAFKELMCQSQSFVREVNNGERSVVSMRDIVRASKVFKWFLTYYSKLRGETSPAVTDGDAGGSVMRIQVSEEMRPHLRNALILTLGYCYHARLSRNHRWGYRKKVCDAWRHMISKDNPTVTWLNLQSEDAFNRTLMDTQLEFVNQMDMGEGISLNEALRENLFMLLVSVMNQIPILLIGKPGCSKSLAMEVLQNNLNGGVSHRPFFQSMPAVEVFPYQCSPLSTPDAILKAFQQARAANLGSTKTIVCVLLDEVGLAEESPHLPLKVLHKELEDLQGISCVGISNWALDAAKMSRCVTLYRPPPTVEDLIVTAEGMVNSETLKGWLKALSQAFFEVYKTQRRPDFWGMREFYSTVRVINTELKLRAAQGLEAALEPQVLMKTVMRNFGGCSADDLDICIEEFFDRVGMDPERLHRYSTPELISQNLVELDARHIMLLTKNNAALRLLFESTLVDHEKAEVMFGGTFPNDLSDVAIAMNLQRIKAFMQKPISLIMVHCDSLYESLYDLFNQHYMDYAGRRYVRIAHGSKSNLREVHKQFRVIVITETSDAYFRLAPPLLNRFEKQVFLRKDLMEKQDEVLLKKMTNFWKALQECVGSVTVDVALDELEAPEPETTDAAPVCQLVAGYHPELLSSLVFTLRRSKELAGKELEELYLEARKKLTNVLTPEAVFIVAARLSKQEMLRKFEGLDIVEEYFENQRHSDLSSYVEGLVANKAAWLDSRGAQIVAMTYSPIRGKMGGDLKAFTSVAPVEISLHDLSTSHDLEKEIEDFYASVASAPEGDTRFLLIHADPVASTLRMIELCRFTCERTRSRKVGAGTGGNAFIMLVVHLQRGMEKKFSFDFDSQWGFVFLDSVEPEEASAGPSTGAGPLAMPSLAKMLVMSLTEVVEVLDFTKLLKQCFRSALSRLMYPHVRSPGDLQAQINQLLEYLEDDAFCTMVREWVLFVLANTPKDVKVADSGSFGDDKQWFASLATSVQELVLAGTFRAALAGRISVLVTSLLTALLAHLDRNAGLVLLAEPAKRNIWLMLSKESLYSPLSARLRTEAIGALTENAGAQHEVGTDAQTGAKPFVSKFPASWFVKQSITNFRQTTEYLKKAEQLESLTSNFTISKLHEVGFNPTLEPKLLLNYLSDFTAMHLDYTERVSRDIQQSIVRKTLERKKGAPNTPVPIDNVLEIHQLFWIEEKSVAYYISLLNEVPYPTVEVSPGVEVPTAVRDAEKLIDTAPLETLNLDVLLMSLKALSNEIDIVPARGMNVDINRPQDFYRDWLRRKQVVSGLTKDFLSSLRADQALSDDFKQRLTELKSVVEPRIETLSLLLLHVAYPLQLDLKLVKQFAKELPAGKVRHHSTLLAIINLASRLPATGIETALRHIGIFAESWMLDVCLRDAEAANDMDEYCLGLLCSLSAGLSLGMQASSAAGIVALGFDQWKDFGEVCIAKCPTGEIPRSTCLNLALLRKLLVISTGRANEIATGKIEKLLKDVSESETHNDTTFATKYAVLCEEKAQKKFKKFQDIDEWPEMSLEDVFQINGGPGPAKILSDVGEIRWMISQYAQTFCAETIDIARHDKIVKKVNGLLHTANPSLSSVCRSMRLYFLKCMERKKGVSFVRGQLAEVPLSETTWVVRWRDLHDIDFEKFIGAALVPKWNPFAGDDSTEEYKEAKTAVLEVMTSTSVEKLEQFAKTCKQRNPAKQKKEIAGLLLALCQEPGLLAALEEEGHVPAWRPKMNEWLATSKDLPVTDQERMLLRVFAGDHSSIHALPEPSRQFMMPFSVHGGRKMEDLLRWRTLGHLAAVLVAAPQTSVLAAMRRMMLEPKEFTKNEPPFLPGMDEDIRNRVMKALMERGENIWKFKAHWYKCTVCGYNFFIGECGRPMETATCPECNTPIGGRDHTKTAATTEDDESDRSPWGYMLPPADKDEKHVSFREIPAGSARAIRLLLHASMFCGMAAHLPSDGTAMARVYAHLVNPDAQCTMASQNEAEYIGMHFLNDYAQMVEMMSSNVEDLSAALHNLLGHMSVACPDVPKGQAAGGDHSWLKMNLETRNSWEETTEAKYLIKMIKEYDQQLSGLFASWGGAEEDGKFVSELKETADVRDYPKDKRKKEMPQVWAYRTPVTLDALHKNMGVAQKDSEKLQVLSTVLQQPLFPVLEALGCLVGVFEWHQLVMSHFSGRFSRAQVYDMTVQSVLDSFAPADRVKWVTAFQQFKRAWRIAWPYIERHECLEIPEAMRDIVVHEDISMVYCICDSANEGICPLALTQWLVARHNELAQIVAGAVGYPARKVSSRLLSQHDVVNYHSEDLMRFLRTRCVSYGDGGKLLFDLVQLERKLRREMQRPEITVELRAFQWLGETLSQTTELQTVMKQKELPNEVCERIKQELTNPTLANACMQKVAMAVSFILKAGPGLSEQQTGDLHLIKYMRTVLCETMDDVLPSHTARAEVRLSHIDAFVRLLKQIINRDPMDMVDTRYKVDMSKEMEAAILAIKDELPKDLLETLGTFAEAQLGQNGGIGPSTSLMDTMSYVYDAYVLDQNEYTDMRKIMPEGLLMENWGALYRLLKKAE